VAFAAKPLTRDHEAEIGEIIDAIFNEIRDSMDAAMDRAASLDRVRHRVMSEHAAPPEHIVEFAIEMATCSPCRSKRGAVVFGRIVGNLISRGYNFKPNGFNCDGSEACKATCRTEAVHAEQMALLNAGTRAGGLDLLHAKAVDGRLVSSGGPSCVQCSKLILAAGVAGVWLYDEGWHRYDSTEFHRLSLEASR
jgi:deoxycytidylate deaminase